MQHLKIIDPDTHMTTLMGLVAVIAAHKPQRAVRIDRNLIDRRKPGAHTAAP